MFVENKGMDGRKGEGDTRQVVRIGQASTVRSGSDVTVVTYGATVLTAMDAAKQLEQENIKVEIIDLRSLQPWDHEAVLESVARTHRVVIVHEAVQAFGVGAEIAAWIAQEAFDESDAPIVGVAAPFMPVPFANDRKSTRLNSSH